MSGRHVLDVDDDQDIRELLVSVLKDDGYEAESAKNGHDALEVLERWKADVVVLDLMMPVMDGWTFAERMHEKWGDIPIVVISAATDLQRHGTRLGAAGIIPKPFEIDSLLPLIESVARPGNGDNALF